jgi:hypothetical protein
MRPLLLSLAPLILVSASAAAQPAKQSVVMQMRSNGVASTTECAIDPFVVAPKPPQPQTGTSVCVMGGPFGTGMVGVSIPQQPDFHGNSGVITQDSTFSFNNGHDTVLIRTVVNFQEEVPASAGGVRYFTGTWEITGGTGAFDGIQGQGVATLELGFLTIIQPPPSFARDDLIGWVTTRAH